MIPPCGILIADAEAFNVDFIEQESVTSRLAPSATPWPLGG